jgi:hypothetical protein
MPTIGEIVSVVDMLDPTGRNPKLRPAVIVSATETGFIVVAISSRLDIATERTHVILPWESGGHPRTGLNRKCAAVCFWYEIVSEDRFVTTGKRVSQQHVDAIRERMTSEN